MDEAKELVSSEPIPPLTRHKLSSATNTGPTLDA